MERPRAFAALTLALFLGACGAPPLRGKGGGGSPDDPPLSGELEVDTTLDSSTLKPREGDLATLTFRIRNGTREPLVLRDLTYLADPKLGEVASAAASWQFSMPGSVEYRKQVDEWTYDRARAPSDGKRPRIFSSGLLLSTETVTVRTRLRLLGMPKSFQILYFPQTRSDLERQVYWESRAERDVRYRLLYGNALDAKLLPGSSIDRGGHRVVVFPFAETTDARARMKVLQVSAELQPRAFSFPDAVRKSGGRAPDQYTFSTALDAWVFRRDQGWWLVSPASVSPLPELRQMDRIFYHIDDLGTAKAQVELEDDSVASPLAFRKSWSVLPDRKEGRTRYYVFLNAPDLPRFLEDVRALDFALDVEITPEGGGRLKVSKRPPR